MGGKIVGGAFAASVKLNMAEHQASILESVIRGHHIYKQLVGEILTLEPQVG